MRTIINGKIYNTDTMTSLVTVSRFSNGNYSGSDSVRRTKTGLLALVSTSNGQDLYRCSSIEALAAADLPAAIDGWEITGEDSERLSEFLTEV